MADEAGGHVPATRRQWDERMSAWFERYAHPRWAATECLARDLLAKTRVSHTIEY